MPKGSVKIMRSYDYCHFEVCLGSDEDMTLEQIDLMRKDAQRLVDKAVRQYQIAKAERERAISTDGLVSLRRKVQTIKENFPMSEWTSDQKATIKLLEDEEWKLTHAYDYEDDWEDEED